MKVDILNKVVKESFLNLREKGLLLLVHQLVQERKHNRITTEELLMYSDENIGYLHDVLYTLEMKNYLGRKVIKDTEGHIVGYDYIINYDYLKGEPIAFEGHLIDNGEKY